MSGREVPVTTEACAIAALKTGVCGTAGSDTVPSTALAAAPPLATVLAAVLAAPPLPTVLAALPGAPPLATVLAALLAAPPRDTVLATVLLEAHHRTIARIAAAAALWTTVGGA
jgi:hypothetical protein